MGRNNRMHHGGLSVSPGLVVGVVVVGVVGVGMDGYGVVLCCFGDCNDCDYLGGWCMGLRWQVGRLTR